MVSDRDQDLQIDTVTLQTYGTALFVVHEMSSGVMQTRDIFDTFPSSFVPTLKSIGRPV